MADLEMDALLDVPSHRQSSHAHGITKPQTNDACASSHPQQHLTRCLVAFNEVVGGLHLHD